MQRNDLPAQKVVPVGNVVRDPDGPFPGLVGVEPVDGPDTAREAFLGDLEPVEGGDGGDGGCVGDLGEVGYDWTLMARRGVSRVWKEELRGGGHAWRRLGRRSPWDPGRGWYGAIRG